MKNAARLTQKFHITLFCAPGNLSHGIACHAA
jgi:hypothetical protein